MKKLILVNVLLQCLQVVAMILLLADTLVGAQTLEIICGNKQEQSGYNYIPNFVSTMEKVRAQIQSSGFGTSVTGSGITTAYALSQCYRDIPLDDCILCYSEARTKLPQCYPYVGARIYLDGCFLRSDTYNFFQEYTGPKDRILCGNKTRKSTSFQKKTMQAVRQVVERAPRNDGYARAKVAGSGTLTNESAYVMADCWKSLNTSACKACLQSASQSISGCLPWSEGRALNTGCFMRYSDTNFLNPVPQNGNSRGSATVVVVSVVFPLVVLAVGVSIAVYLWKLRMVKNKRRGLTNVKKLSKALQNSGLNFKFSTLEKATGTFDEANKLGQGGFGTVYKGVLPDGREIAVKRLFYNNRAADFYNEVCMISKLEHKNLVRLLGCSCSGPENLLVYEFLPNLSLDRYIFKGAEAVNWEKRFKVIIGTAEGLVYLHENTKTKIIHRDVKASNILLDRKMRAKISDFGLARSFQGDNSHISTRIVGTLGYMAPEYLSQGKLTEKADVYSFGVLLMEMVTGRQNIGIQDEEEYSYSLVTTVWKHFQHDAVEALFDPNLMLHNYHYIKNLKDEVSRVVHIALLCTQEASLLRPSMSKALQMLTKTDESLPEPSNPPFLDEETMGLNNPHGPPFYRRNRSYSASVATMSNGSFQPR